MMTGVLGREENRLTSAEDAVPGQEQKESGR